MSERIQSNKKYKRIGYFYSNNLFEPVLLLNPCLMKDSIIPFYKRINRRIIQSKDFWVIDSDGKQYVDFESGDWAANLGHSNERIVQAIKNQVDLLIHDGLNFRNRESEELSLLILEKLNLTNGKSTFLNSGSEAVNLAITIAKRLTGRNKILKIEGTFLSSYGHGQISDHNENLLSIGYDHIEAMDAIDFAEIAAFVFEPGNSWGLVKFAPVAFVEALAAVTQNNGGYVIANEVTTGFGRTGKWFGFQHYPIQPDIVAMGKGLGNGYPISAVSISEAVAETFDKKGFRYAQSHQNDPLGCAIGTEVIKTFVDTGIIEQSKEKGTFFYEMLTNLQQKHPDQIKEIRARGLMLAIEFTPEVSAETLRNQLFDAGFIVGCKENTIRFMPPLTINETSIWEMINAMDKFLN
jgi:acetylornithine aminotransferase